jgi:hypothetical protein
VWMDLLTFHFISKFHILHNITIHDFV